MSPYIQLFAGPVDASGAAASPRNIERTEASVDGGVEPDWSSQPGGGEQLELQLGAADTHLHLAVFDEHVYSESGGGDGESVLIGERKICLSSIAPAGTKAEKEGQSVAACDLLEELRFSAVDSKAIWVFSVDDGATVGKVHLELE